MKNLVKTAVISSLSLPLISQDRPNILLFLVDDMGAMDTSVPFMADKNGQPQVNTLNQFFKTPAMEQLAKDGLRFSTFYANSVCSPTRASIMTGQSSARNRTTQFISPFGRNSGPKEWNWDGLNKQSVTLPRLLQKSGYQTIHCGKAHFGPLKSIGADPLNLGFDINIAGGAFGRPFSYYGEKNYGKGFGDKVPRLDKYFGTETFLTEALTIEAKAELTKAAKSPKPFYLYMSQYALHGPFNPDPRFIDNYKDSSYSARGKAFASLVEGMDKSLNDLLKHLESIDEAENTLVIFLGDNGSDAPIGGNAKVVKSCAPLRGKKGSCYEGGTRVPFIVSWAKVNPNSKLQQKFKIKPGFITDKFATVEDLFPTILKLADVKAPKEHRVDGEDILDFFATHKGKRKQEFLMHFPHNHNSSYFTSLVDGDWKLIYHYPAPPKKNKKGKKNRKKEMPSKIELFNLKNDLSESKNLAAKNPEKVKKLFKKMVAKLEDAKALHNVDAQGNLILPKL